MDFSVHPLLIDHVVENIFQFIGESVNINDLKNCRFVCRLWNEVGTKALSANSSEVIKFGKFFRPVCSIKDLCNLVHKPSGCRSFPCTKFQLCQDVFQLRHASLLHNLFITCCPFMSSLIIRLDHESTWQSKTCMTEVSSFLKLKSFIFDDRRKLSDDNETQLIRTILSKSPNLEKFSFHQNSHHISFSQDAAGGNANSDLIESYVEQILNVLHTSKLKTLQLDIPFTEQTLESLVKKLSPFNVVQNLSMCLRSSSFSPDSLNKFFLCFQENLKQLRLGGICRKSSFEIQFAEFPLLEVLEVHGWCASTPNVRFTPFSFERCFPALKSLSMSVMSQDSSWYQFFGNNNNSEAERQKLVGVPSIPQQRIVKHLKLPEEFINPAIFQNTCYWTKLKTLQVHLTDDSQPLIESVFSCLIQLEEIKFLASSGPWRTSKCIDNMLTGLPSSACKKLLRQERLEEYEFQPCKTGINKLRNLKVLDLSEVLKQQVYVTDVSGYLVFNRMRRLRRLRIRKSKMSFKCLSVLAGKYPEDLELEVKAYEEDLLSQSQKSSGHSCVIV